MGDYENALLNLKKALKIKEETLTMRKYRACELRVPILHRHGFYRLSAVISLLWRELERQRLSIYYAAASVGGHIAHTLP